MVEIGGETELDQRLDERARDEDHVVTRAAACRDLAHDLFVGRVQREFRLDAGLLGEVLEEIAGHVGVPVGNDDLIGSLRSAECRREAEERGCNPSGVGTSIEVSLPPVLAPRPLLPDGPTAQPRSLARRRTGHCSAHYTPYGFTVPSAFCKGIVLFREFVLLEGSRLRRRLWVSSRRGARRECPRRLPVVVRASPRRARGRHRARRARPPSAWRGR